MQLHPHFAAGETEAQREKWLKVIHAIYPTLSLERFLFPAPFLGILFLKKKKKSHLGTDQITEMRTHHMNGQFTYVAQMQGVEAGSGEIRVVGHQGVPVSGFSIPQPVKALQGEGSQ